MQVLCPMKILWSFQIRFHIAREIHARNTRLLGDACGEGAVQNMNGILGYPTHNIEQRKMSAKILLWQRLIKHIDQEIKNGIA